MTAAPDRHALLELAVDVALGAGRLLVGGRPRDLGVAATKTSPTDVVTEMDRASERLIVDRIHAARPDDGFLGEEGAADEGTSGVRWVIDPIDGTVNYLYDLPEWAVSVAAEQAGEVLVGVVHVPTLGQTYTAVRGEGAHRDGVRLRREPVTDLDRALVSTGFSYESDRRRAQGRIVAEVLPRVRDVRRGGSCAVDLCNVAAARVDAYYERGVHRWDYAAAGLVAEEAGVRVEGLHGAPASGDFLLAAPDPLFGALHDLLAELGAGAA